MAAGLNYFWLVFVAFEVLIALRLTTSGLFWLNISRRLQGVFGQRRSDQLINQDGKQRDIANHGPSVPPS